MDKEFWFTRWRKNEIGFHLTEPHHLLQELFPLPSLLCTSIMSVARTNSSLTEARS